MSEAGEFIDATLRDYGSSIGAIRAAVRDATRKFHGLRHDEITALSSELWAVPLYERRYAAIVLLQSHLLVLVESDLTRIEGFVRTAATDDLLDPLIDLVIAPLALRLAGTRAGAVFKRWRADDNRALRRAGNVASLE